MESEAVMGSTSGKLLRVNLSKNSLRVEKISKDLFKKYIGGRGLGVKILSDEVNPKTEPFGEANKVIFAAGPLTGTSIPTAARYEVVTKSPLTGTITGANAGGVFGARLKKAGLDAIVIEGKAKVPVFLWVDDEDYEIKVGEELWGSDTHQTTDKIKKIIGKKSISVACIGPAGEHLVKFASVINDKHRAAARGGAGAVLGAKKLKAIAVFGSKEIDMVDQNIISKKNRMILDKIKNTTVTNVNLREYGTAKILDSVNDYKLLGTKNFQINYFEHAKDINAEKLKNTLLIKNKACYRCPIPCKRVTRVDGKTGEGPEFETIWAFGAQCGIRDIKLIARANYLCNELGLDTISTGNTIGCAIELSEKGFIPEKLSFGDGKKILELTEMIAYREGFGDGLAEGSFRLAESAGHPEVSMSVKKLELPAYDPRGAFAQGLGYATSTRGACHVRAFVIKSDIAAGTVKLDKKSINSKVSLVKKTQDLAAVIDSLGLCLFSSFVCTIDDYWEYLEAATNLGLKTSDELLKAGERIWTLERVFNNNSGFTPLDDELPKRFAQEHVTDSLGNAHVWPENILIEHYYRKRGWTPKGIPTKKKLDELDI